MTPLRVTDEDPGYDIFISSLSPYVLVWTSEASVADAETHQRRDQLLTARPWAERGS